MFTLRSLAGMVLLATFIASCGPRKPTGGQMPAQWAAGASDAVGLKDPVQTENAVYRADQSKVVLRGAVNDVVAFEYVLAAGNATYGGLQVTATGLTGSNGAIPREAARIYRHWPVTVDRFPNWYLRSIGLREPRAIPDALVPIDAPRQGQPFNLPAGENLVLWVEIRIPPETNVGKYAGSLEVTNPAGGSIRTLIELEVLDFFLDPAQGLPVVANVQVKPLIAAHTEVDPENMRLVTTDPEARRVITETFRLLHEHGLAPMTDDIYPRFSQDLDGSILFDWTDYDALCGPLIDGSAYGDGRYAAAWPLPVDLDQPDPGQHGGIDSTTYSAILSEYLSLVAAHFRDKAWLDRAYVQFEMPTDVAATTEDFERVRRLATLTHFVEPGLSFASRLIPQSMVPFGWFEHVHEDLTSLVDVWATPARFQHPATLTRLQTFGKRTWLAPDRPPYSGSLTVEAPPIHARSLAWQAFLQGHEAIFLSEVSNWPEGFFDKPIRSRRQPSDTWLVYPGKLFGLDTPVPSVRLKQLQLGLQDYHRLNMLRLNGREETARLIAGSLIKASGTDAYGNNYQDGLLGRRIENPATWELARRILDDEVRSALQPPSTTQPGGAPRQDWIQFLSQTRTIESWIESARLRFDDRPDREGWLLAIDVNVRSEMRTPIEGELRFGELPYGLRNISDEIRVGPLNEWNVARRQLVARSEAVPVANLDGHFVQPVVFNAGASGLVDVPATVSIVQVPPAPHPITIDGKLDDWPPSAFNAAGDFRLLTNRAGMGRERPRAESQTIAYFLESRGMLYVGVHAGTPKRGGNRASSSDAGGDEAPGDARGTFQNFVEYEDLVPVGEDLVEIVLDPSNKATQSGDLFHIVIKSSGNPRFERGIGTEPPIGEVQPWPGPLPDCSVAATDYGWSAEIAIPIASLGADAEAHPVWGMNLARLEPVRGEYSDWARVPRYCYDPNAMGNLVWPE
ncbi:MAG TPA: glycoside hydrolase domain-containing protein [Phycisphaerae bacterium]|nr:glycoside hydrolase domain-containing protein [Phycisphaerae bacterium]